MVSLRLSAFVIGTDVDLIVSIRYVHLKASFLKGATKKLVRTETCLSLEILVLHSFFSSLVRSIIEVREYLALLEFHNLVNSALICN